MKQKDIALIVVIVIITGVVSIVLSNILIPSPNKKRQSVEVVEPITAEFAQPDQKYFNKNSVNPTQTIKIGEGLNPAPFNDTNRQ